MAGGKVMVRHLVLAACAGTVLANQLAVNLGGTEVVHLTLFVAPVILFMFLLGKHKDKGNRVLNLVAGLVAGVFLAASAIAVLPSKNLPDVTGGSFIATELHIFYPIILGAALVLTLVSSLAKQAERSHH